MIKNADEIKKVLENDGVIAYVTDTVWGLGCLPSSEKGVKKIYEIKKREAQKPLILMSDDIYHLLAYVKIIPKKGQQLVKKYFPGALTLVVKKNPEMTPDYMTSGLDTVGIRVPDNEVCFTALTISGFPPQSNCVSIKSPSFIPASCTDSLTGCVPSFLMLKH